MLPQRDAEYSSFEVSGGLGRECLVAVVTEECLGLGWMSTTYENPARVLDSNDVDLLLNRLHELDDNSWECLWTFFDVVP